MSCSWYDCFLEFCFCKKGLLLQIYEKNRKIGEVGEIEEISVIGVIGEIGVIKKYSTYNTYTTYSTYPQKNRNPTRDCGQYSESSEKLFLTAEIPPPKKLYRKSSLSPTLKFV
jgi:hypothetical protein